MLEFKNISKSFKPAIGGKRELLKNISIRFEPGKLMGILGANGCGKSTFFRILSGEYSFDQGEIFLEGQLLSNKTTYQRSSFITQVKQNPLENVFSGLNIFQNMVLASKRGRAKTLAFYARKSQKDKFYQILKSYHLGLEEFIEESVDILSGGQKQALAVIMATLSSSKILLFDEHCSALDPNMTKKIMDLSQQIVHEQKLIGLMITHDIHYALSHSDAYVILKDKNFTASQKPNNKISAETIYKAL